MAKIFMPVIAVDELCMNCPELDISVNHSVLYSDGIDMYVNEIFCNHYKKCRQRERYRKQENEDGQRPD